VALSRDTLTNTARTKPDTGTNHVSLRPIREGQEYFKIDEREVFMNLIRLIILTVFATLKTTFVAHAADKHTHIRTEKTRWSFRHDLFFS
jgi:hypothetical protein